MSNPHFIRVGRGRDGDKNVWEVSLIKKGLCGWRVSIWANACWLTPARFRQFQAAINRAEIRLGLMLAREQ